MQYLSNSHAPKHEMTTGQSETQTEDMLAKPFVPKSVKSSLRHKARAPIQERGIIRYNKLLDATNELLEHHEIEDLGIYQIAKHAGVPPASAYHFFPTPGAALIGLADRYLEQFRAMAFAQAPPTERTQWQAVLRDRLQVAAEYYEKNLPVRKLLLGCHTTRELVVCNMNYNTMLAKKIVESNERDFHMPFIRNADLKYLVALTAVDAIYSLSQTIHGRITAEFFEEAVNSAIAYFRTFLPDRLEPR